MQAMRRNTMVLLRIRGLTSLEQQQRRWLTIVTATTNRNPYDFSPEGGNSLEAASFGEDEFTRQQRPQSGIDEAKQAAIRLLGMRSHSRKELKTKLLEREHALDAVNSVIHELEKAGLQDDGQFAEQFARSKWRQVKWGPSRIRSELMRKGVAEEVCKEALESVFSARGLNVRRYLEEEAAEDTQCAWNYDITPEPALVDATRRQYQLTRGQKKETRERRLSGWLQRRGHNWADITQLMKHVEREELAKMEEEGEEEEA